MLVPVSDLRVAVERSGMTYSEIARALDWYDYSSRPQGRRPRPDRKRVKRMLGVSHWKVDGGTRRVYQTHMRSDNALKIARVIGADPIDVGL